jgi:glycosyltransferase involved in cell wall biosynthesis
LLNRNKFNHVLTFCGSPVYVGYIGYFASKILNSESSLWIQDIWPEAIETTIGIKNKILRSIIYKSQNFMFKFCDMIFSESQALSNYLISENLNKKIVTLYNPVRNESTKVKILNKKNGLKNTFSYIGNIGGAQNIELLLRSFKNAKLENSELNICGDGGLFQELSSKYSSSDILWHGWIDGDKLEKIYNDSDFFILSLNSVGRQGLILPSKVQSYFMHKRPIICISSGAPKELIQECGAGFVCENINEKEIVKMFNYAENSSFEERSKMSINAYKYYEDNFKKEKIVDKFLQSI